MNKYIKTDIEQGLLHLKVGISNALADIEKGRESYIDLGEHVPFSLVVECAEVRGWTEDPDMNWDWTNGWEVDCWYYMHTPNKQKVCISSCLWKGQSTQIKVLSDDE